MKRARTRDVDGVLMFDIALRTCTQRYVFFDIDIFLVIISFRSVFLLFLYIILLSVFWSMRDSGEKRMQLKSMENV